MVFSRSWYYNLLIFDYFEFRMDVFGFDSYRRLFYGLRIVFFSSYDSYFRLRDFKIISVLSSFEKSFGIESDDFLFFVSSSGYR